MIRFEKRIYIPLPDVHARRRMFELNVGTTPHGLTPQDFQQLAELTDGYVFLPLVLAPIEADEPGTLEVISPSLSEMHSCNPSEKFSPQPISKRQVRRIYIFYSTKLTL